MYFGSFTERLIKTFLPCCAGDGIFLLLIDVYALRA